MRLKSADLVLLNNVFNMLQSLGETECATELSNLIKRLEYDRQIEREKNRQRATNNRKAGYAWKSSFHPKRSKWYNDKQDFPYRNKKGDKNES